MASKSDIEAGRAFVRLFLKNDLTKQLAKAMKSSGEAMKDFGAQAMKIGAGITAAGLAGLAPVIAGVKAFTSMGGAAVDAAARTGLSVESLSELGFAAEQTGATLDDVEVGVKKMSTSIQDLATGSKSAQEMFGRIGVAMSDLQGLSPDRQFSLIASRIADIQDPTMRAAAAVEFFGRSGTKLLPMIGDMDALRKKARDLGIVMSTEDAQAADDLGDTIDQLKAQFKAMLFQVGRAVAGPLLQFGRRASEYASRAIAWVKANGQLIITFAKVAAAVTVVGGVVTGLGAAVYGLGVALTTLGVIAGAVGAVLAAVFSPLGLTVAAVVAGAVAWAKWTDSGQAAVGFIRGQLAGALQFLKSVFGGVSAAINAGDISLAWEIVATAGRLAIAQIGDRVRWVFGDLLPGLAKGAMSGLASAFSVVAASWLEILSMVWENAKTIGGEAIRYWWANFSSQMQFAVDVFSAVWDTFKSFGISAVNATIQNLAAATTDTMITIGQFALETLGSAFIDAVKWFEETAMSAAKRIAKAFVSAMKGKGPIGGGVGKSYEGTRGLLAQYTQARTQALMGAGQAVVAGVAGQYTTEPYGQATGAFGEKMADATRRHMERVAAAGKDAAAAILPGMAAFNEAMKSVGGAAKDNIVQQMNEAFAAVPDFRDSDAVEGLRATLGLLTETAKALPSGAVPGSVPGAATGAVPGAGVIGSRMATPANLTTYNAAALQAAGQVGGGGGSPQEKMSQSMSKMERNFEKVAKLMEDGKDEPRKMREALDRFLLGWIHA